MLAGGLGCRIGLALEADPNDLLRAAGRYATGSTFEETVLARLEAIGRLAHCRLGDVDDEKQH